MTSAATVAPVQGARDRRAFVALPYALHRHDPNWPPLLRREVRALLDPRTNPFFAHGEAGCFLARRDGRVVGRVAAIRNHLARRRGIDALLYKRIWDEARALGYDWAEAGWVLEDNLPMRNALERMGFARYKTYRVYERPA